MTSQFDDVFGEEISHGGRHFVVDQGQTLVRILNVMQMPRLLNVQLFCGGLTRRYYVDSGNKSYLNAARAVFYSSFLRVSLEFISVSRDDNFLVYDSPHFFFIDFTV
jgi:hypothetical protein